MASNQDHFYEIDGIKYPRVTSILNAIDKPGLARWRGRIGNTEADRVSKEGAKVGTAFHEIAADINRGMHRERGWRPPEELRAMAFSYIDWLNRNVDEIVAVERLVYSQRRRYAGTTDLVAILKGDDLPTVLDIKTSNSVSPEWPLQLSAYKMALTEEGIITLRRAIVHVPKKGDPTAIQYTYMEHEDDAEAWLQALGIWNWIQRDKERTKAALAYSR